MKLISALPVDEQDLEQVRDMLAESKCPHESLFATFPRYSGLDDDYVFFDDVTESVDFAQHYEYEI